MCGCGDLHPILQQTAAGSIRSKRRRSVLALSPPSESAWLACGAIGGETSPAPSPTLRRMGWNAPSGGVRLATPLRAPGARAQQGHGGGVCPTNTLRRASRCAWRQHGPQLHRERVAASLQGGRKRRATYRSTCPKQSSQEGGVVTNHWLNHRCGITGERTCEVGAADRR